jgi:hypothetical protein
MEKLPMTQRFLVALVVCLVGGRALPGVAQSVGSADSRSSSRVPALDGEVPEFAVHLNLRRAVASPIGQMVLETIARHEPEFESKLASFAEAAGLDPRSEIHEIAIWGDLLEGDNPLAAASAAGAASMPRVVVRLGSRPGNLEGWLLAAPGYESTSLDDETLLHSFLIPQEGRRNRGERKYPAKVSAGEERANQAPDDEASSTRVWCAIARLPHDDCYVVVAAFDEQAVVRLVQRIRAEGLSLVQSQLAGDEVLHVSLEKMPSLEIDPQQPGAGLIASVQGLQVAVKSTSQALEVRADVATGSPAKARQISQLLTGLMALMELAADDVDPEAQKMMALVRGRAKFEHEEGSSHLSGWMTLENELVRSVLENAR